MQQDSNCKLNSVPSTREKKFRTLKQSIMRLIITTTLLFFISFLNAQTYVDLPWTSGTVMQDGQEIEGKLRLGGGEHAPWLNHTKVYFVKKADWIAGKRPRKKVIETYLPDDIDGYNTTLALDDGDVIDLAFQSFEIMIMGALKKKKGMAFLKILKEGKVTAYSYVPMPSEKILADANERAKDNAAAIHQTSLYLSKDKKVAEHAPACTLVELFADCPTVVEKIKSEAYGFKPLHDRPVKKGLGKMMSNVIGDNKLENQIFEAVKEYNACN